MGQRAPAPLELFVRKKEYTRAGNALNATTTILGCGILAARQRMPLVPGPADGRLIRDVRARQGFATRCAHLDTRPLAGLKWANRLANWPRDEHNDLIKSNDNVKT